nr:MAG TPA: hypothetical protein [Caudoviricetes sp.]
MFFIISTLSKRLLYFAFLSLPLVYIITLDNPNCKRFFNL